MDCGYTTGRKDFRVTVTRVCIYGVGASERRGGGSGTAQGSVVDDDESESFARWRHVRGSSGSRAAAAGVCQLHTTHL